MLAAGKGRRIELLSRSLPKPLLPVLDRALVDWQLAALRAAGVRAVTLVIGHLGEKLVEHVGDGSRHGLAVRTVEQGEPRGIAHALLAAAPHLERAFVCLLGDVYFEPGDLLELVRVFCSGAFDGVLAARADDDPREFARNYSVELDGRGLVRGLIEKPGETRGLLRGVGLYVLCPAVLIAARATPPSALRGEQELTEALQRFIRGGARLAAVEIGGHDVNLTEPADLLRANLQALASSGRESFVDPSARVEPGTSLERSVVLARAHVPAGTRLVRSLVLPDQVLEPGSYSDALFAGGTRISCAGRW